MNDKHKLTDAISDTMRELFETAENDMIARANLAIVKGDKTFKINSAGEELIKEVVNRAAKLADFEPEKIIKKVEKGTQMLIASADNYFKQGLKNVERLKKVIPLYDAIYKQTQLGINHGLKVTYKNGRQMGYKEYMEMNVRTTIQHEISEKQIKYGGQAGIVFYLCNVYGDCADDHADYQGKLYYDETVNITDERVNKYIRDNKLLSIQQVRDDKPYLTTRPNCRHNLISVSVEQVLNDGPEKLLTSLKLRRGTYKEGNYDKTQEQRSNERNIRFYKARMEQNELLYKEMPSDKLREQIQVDKVLMLKWQKKQRELIKANPDILERDYRRETRKILLNDLGVKYNKGGNNNTPPTPPITPVIPPVKPYVPFKTVKEAEKFASENLVVEATRRIYTDESIETPAVNFRGLNIGQANKINEAIYNNINGGMPKLRMITARALKSQTGVAARINQFGDLEINTITLGTEEKFAELMNKSKQLFGEEGRKTFKELYENKDKLDSKAQRLINIVEKKLKYSRETVGDDVASTINHEMMHHYMQGQQIKEKEERKAFKKRWNDAAAASLNSEYKYKISAYGGETNYDLISEHLAENYSAYKLGEYDNIHPELLKLFKEEMK